MKHEPQGLGERDFTPEPTVAGYRVELPAFEGPLDLLLHLIEQHDLDILDIPIGFVAEKYLEYLMLMQELNIDIASEYLVMAATLAHIKSKMLLPVVPEDQDEAMAEEELDPRALLISRLLEYQKYRDAAQRLAERAILGRDVFSRGTPAPQAAAAAPLERLGLFRLLDAFQRVLSRVQKKLDHEVELDRLSITERINQLYDLLRQRGRALFEELFEGLHTRTDLIVTFLALLEMTRLGMTRLYQAEPFRPISIELTDAGPPPSSLKMGDSPANPAPPTVDQAGSSTMPTAAERDQAVMGKEPSQPEPAEMAEIEPGTGQEIESAGEGTEFPCSEPVPPERDTSEPSAVGAETAPQVRNPSHGES